ncbi:MAG TPA: threonine-phosphate decarboxylase CobD [Rhodanobacteraceae bacterium]
MLEHGGRLRQAAKAYGIPLTGWLDLSTGVSPFAYPLPEVPARVWQRLPEDDDGLAAAAEAYYRVPVLPVAGSQAAIQALPHLRDRSRVGVIEPGYAEHAQAWERAGHAVQRLSPDAVLKAVSGVDVLVVIHPNNPTGTRFDRTELLAAAAALSAHGGWLVVDEAFMDATPGNSLCAGGPRDGLVVLRSAGKFFGLPSARAGFVCATSSLLNALREWLGPWSLAGPTRYVISVALADRRWQAQQRVRLHAASTQLANLLAARGLAPSGGCALFQWCRHPDAAAIQHHLAARGILVRLFEHPPSLRFGLPGSRAASARLEAALAEVLA